MLTSCDLDTIPTTYVDAGSVFGKTGDAEKVLNGGWNYLMETFNSYANPAMEQCYVQMTQWVLM